MRRGEVWWARIDERRPVVLLTGDEAGEYRAVEIVAPATAAQRHGYTVLSGEEALGYQPVAGERGVGVEVALGTPEGLADDGVVRVALRDPGFIPCVWLVTLAREHLLEQAGALSTGKLAELDNALRLAGIE